MQRILPSITAPHQPACSCQLLCLCSLTNTSGVVKANKAQLPLPPSAFGLTENDLLAVLEAASSVEHLFLDESVCDLSALDQERC
jgi:hypothetical protein